MEKMIINNEIKNSINNKMVRISIKRGVNFLIDNKYAVYRLKLYVF